MKNQHFFMVYIEEERIPFHRHSSLKGAEEESEILSKQYGKEAFVLFSMKSFGVNKFKVEDSRTEIDDLPF